MAAAAPAEATGLRLRWERFRAEMYAPIPRPDPDPQVPPVDENEVRRRHRALVRRLSLRLLWLLGGDVFVGCAVYLFCIWMGSPESFAGKTTNFFADAFYFSSTTLTTTGYGDDAPVSSLAKVLTSLYIVLNSIYINFFVYPLVGHILELIEGRGFVTKGKVVMGFVYALISILIGVPCLICLGGFSVGNAFYTVVVSFSSTGFGDYSFVSVWARIFGSVWLQLSHLVNCRVCGLVGEAGDERLVRDYVLKSNSVLEREVSAQAAERVLLEAKRDSEISLQRARIDHRTQLADVHKQLGEAQTRLLQAQNVHQAQLEAAQTNLLQTQNVHLAQLEAVQKAANESQNESKALQGRVDQYDSQVKDLQKAANESQNESNALQGRVDQYDSQVKDLQIQLARAISEGKKPRVQQVLADKEVEVPGNQAEAASPKTSPYYLRSRKPADKEIKAPENQAEAGSPKRPRKRTRQLSQ